MLPPVWLAVLLVLPPVAAGGAVKPSSTQALLAKAKLLESHGRLDMAAQTWQQVLLADRANTAALAGLARVAKAGGNPALAKLYAERLHAVQDHDAKTGEQAARPGAAAKGHAGPAAQASDTAAEEAAAFAALQRRDYVAAERRLRLLLQKNPENASALAGMGSLRMEQGNYGGAISFLEEAKQRGAVGVDPNLTRARYLFLVQQAEIALHDGDAATAESEYRQALSVRPFGTEALLGLGGLLLKAGRPVVAEPLLEAAVKLKPAATEGWRGLVMAEALGDDPARAVATDNDAPESVRAELRRDTEYVQTLAFAYRAVGRQEDATRLLQVPDTASKPELKLAAASAPVGADEIDLARAMLSRREDEALFALLMALGARTDLREGERRAVQTIWVEWAVQRAREAAAAGNSAKSLQILNAARQAFPENAVVIRALANSYVQAGTPRLAVALYRNELIAGRPAVDYETAASAALAAKDWKDAETWLRSGLQTYPGDSEMLRLAAQFEAARGRKKRAAEYAEAAERAKVAADPGAELVAALQPDAAKVGALPNASQPGDLSSVLAPVGERRESAPYLPGEARAGSAGPVEEARAAVPVAKDGVTYGPYVPYVAPPQRPAVQIVKPVAFDVPHPVRSSPVAVRPPALRRAARLPSRPATANRNSGFTPPAGQVAQPPSGIRQQYPRPARGPQQP